MYILGIDSSFSSPGFVWAELDDKTLEIVQQDYLGFTSTKKFKNNNIYFYEKKNKEESDNIIGRYLMFVEVIKDVLKMHERQFLNVALEDYAYNCSGQLTKLAETCGAIKVMFYNHGSKIRLYEIGNIKRFATGNGKADKFEMEEVYESLPLKERIDLSYLPMVKEKKTGNPKDNIVDAYFIMRFLQTELKVRKGLITLQDLPDHQRKSFLLVTKANPINLPVRSFIQKETNE
jgi:Holliday junction resolvasome RuvABC endonuclease subunit